MPYDFVSFSDCNFEKVIVWCISDKKSYEDLTKISIFQAIVTERCDSLSKTSGIFWQNPLKVPMKKLKIYDI